MPSIEEKSSVEAHHTRRRDLLDVELQHGRHDNNNNDKHHTKHKRKHRHRHKKHKHRPAIRDGTQHGMMIDAGSQGTRIHVYEFEARILENKRSIKDAAIGRKLSIPTTDTRWTNRLTPGLDAFAAYSSSSIGSNGESDGSGRDDRKMQVAEYLSPLLDFTKDILKDKKQHWGHYPIYLKATGGLRALPRPYRIELMEIVREIMHNTTFNPFFFEDEHARVISGEEEAIYGWAAVNFVQGTLIPNSEGSGSVLQANKTYGVLEMGGASTQIGFFEPFGDLMANLFKLQIGAAKHWNVYAHSFLYFGINGAYDRLNARLYTLARDQNLDEIYNPCLPGQTDYLFTSRVHTNSDGTMLPLSAPYEARTIEAELYSAVLRNPYDRGDFDQCQAQVILLLRKSANAWCDFAHDRDCSFAGIYQPPLPIDESSFGEFIATSNFYHAWEFLKLPPRSTLSSVRDGARHVCNMSMTELKDYNTNLTDPIPESDVLKQMCFRTTFVAAFLIDGVGFPENYTVTAIDVINGQKVGWALGSMLYEINTLPWKFKKHILHRVTNLEIFEDVDTSDLVVMFGPLLVAFMLLIAIVRLRRSLGVTGRPIAECTVSETTALVLETKNHHRSYKTTM